MNDDAASFAEQLAAFGPAVMEPRAEYRQAAAGLYELYAAYLSAGFNQVEAMTLLVNLIAMGQQR